MTMFYIWAILSFQILKKNQGKIGGALNWTNHRLEETDCSKLTAGVTIPDIDEVKNITSTGAQQIFLLETKGAMNELLFNDEKRSNSIAIAVSGTGDLETRLSYL